MKSVTVVIPVYNPNREWFEACLASVPQDRVDVIICDDCSDTPVPEATIRHERNTGPAESWNSCIELATTKWIAPLGHDDSFDSEGLSELLNVIDEVDADLIHFPVRVFPGPWIWKCEDARLESMLQGNCIPGTTWMTKEAWQRNGKYQYVLCEDWDFLLRAAKTGMRFHYFPRILYNYRSDSHGYYETVVVPNEEKIRKDMREKYGSEK